MKSDKETKVKKKKENEVKVHWGTCSLQHTAHRTGEGYACRRARGSSDKPPAVTLPPAHPFPASSSTPPSHADLPTHKQTLPQKSTSPANQNLIFLPPSALPDPQPSQSGPSRSGGVSRVGTIAPPTFPNFWHQILSCAAALVVFITNSSPITCCNLRNLIFSFLLVAKLDRCFFSETAPVVCHAGVVNRKFCDMYASAALV